MTPDQAADLAARTLAAIDRHLTAAMSPFTAALVRDHRERVASDLAGLRDVERLIILGADGQRLQLLRTLQTRYADGLRRTAALYGVTA